MTYRQILNKLEKKANSSLKVSSDLKEAIEYNAKNYIGDFWKSENDRVDKKAKDQLKSNGEEGQRILDDGLSAFQEHIDVKYFNDITSQVAGELDQIEKSDLSIDDAKAYLKKFKDNPSALRRLDEIVKKNDMKIEGITYSQEVDYLKAVKNLGQSLVDSLYTGDLSRIRISLSLLESKVNNYEEYANRDKEVVEDSFKLATRKMNSL